MEQGIPEWALWLAGAFGTFMAAFVARMGWKSGDKPHTTTAPTFGLAGALVDNRSVDTLSSMVSEQAEAIREQAAATKEQTAALKSLGNVDASRVEMLRSLTVSLQAIADGVKQWNVFHEREEDDRQRREREKLERENERLTERMKELLNRPG